MHVRFICVCVYVTIHIYEHTKTKLILDFLFILITLVGLYNIHVLNYTRNLKIKIAYQTLENIFKVVTKHRKMK